MSLEVKIPAVGESITSGLLSTWHKNDGDTVAVGDVLLTLETDKVSTEIQADKAGTLRIEVAAGSEVKIGEIVATIEDAGAAAPAPAAEKTKTSGEEKIRAKSGNESSRAVTSRASTGNRTQHFRRCSRGQ